MRLFLVRFCVLVGVLATPAAAAACCQTANANANLGADANDDAAAAAATATATDRQTLMRSVRALDRLHQHWLQRKLLDALRLDAVPPDAGVWRRKRDQQRRSVERRDADLDVDHQPATRRYTLRIVGVPLSDAAWSRHRHRRRHHTGGDCQPVRRYAFYSRLSPSRDHQVRLESAHLELPSSRLSAARYLQLRSSASTGAANRTDGGWWPVPGPSDHPDITSRLLPLWTSDRDANYTLSLLYDTPDSQDCNNGGRRTATTTGDHDDDDDQQQQQNTPVLALSLIETAKVQMTKRSVDGNHSQPQRRAGRRPMVEDCERQWDAAFLSSTTPSQYDDLMPCCRRRVRIDFNDVGWDHWIISPAAFDSYYCMGRCTNFGGFASSDTDGPAFYTETMNLYRDARNGGLTPCCSPVKFSPLTITVLASDTEEMTQTLEDVVVRECGCM